MTTQRYTRQPQHDRRIGRGYASPRTMGDFISEAILEHHRRQRLTREKPLTKAEIAAELRTLADVLEKAK
jgi:hypothetical protein